jgi:hypothetical protein
MTVAIYRNNNRKTNRPIKERNNKDQKVVRTKSKQQERRRKDS